MTAQQKSGPCVNPLRQCISFAGTAGPLDKCAGGDRSTHRSTSTQRQLVKSLPAATALVTRISVARSPVPHTSGPRPPVAPVSNRCKGTPPNLHRRSSGGPVALPPGRGKPVGMGRATSHRPVLPLVPSRSRSRPVHPVRKHEHGSYPRTSPSPDPPAPRHARPSGRPGSGPTA